MREQGSKNRYRQTDDIRKQNWNRGFRPFRNEPEQRRPSGWTRYDDDRVGYLEKQLSCLNEKWASKGSASMKFEWGNLLLDKPDKSGFGLRHRGRMFIENENVGFSKRPISMCPTEQSARYDSKAYVATTEPLSSLKNDHNVMNSKGYFGESLPLKSSALMNSVRDYHGEYDCVCKNIASAQYDCRPQNYFRTSIVDSIVEKIEGSYSSHKVLNHHGGLSNKELNIGHESHVMEQNGDCFRTSIVEKLEGSHSSNKVLDHYGGGLEIKELNVGNESRVMEQNKECFRASIVDSVVDKLESSHSSNKVLDHYGGLNNRELNVSNESRVMEQDRECSGSRISYISQGSQAMEQDGEGSGSRGFHVERASEVNLDCGGLSVEYNYGFERDGGLRLAMSNDDDVVTKNVGRSKQMVIEEELGIKDSSSNLLKRGRVVDLSMVSQHPRHQNVLYENGDKFQPILAATGKPSKSMFEGGRFVDLSMTTQRAEQKISFSWISSDKYYDTRNVDERWTSEDIEHFSDVKNLGFRQTVEETASKGMLPSLSLPGSMQEEHSSEPVKPSNINIKKRLGPALSIKERLGPVRSVKKRLGHVSKLIEPSSQVAKKILMPAQNCRMSLPSVKQNKFRRSDLDDLHGGSYVQGGNSFEIKKKSYKNEPLENSEKFEQLVHNAYMKFVKALNENQAQKKKFTQQGTTTLKCRVCGSFSKEFVDTLNLANHAFMTKQAGLRAEHLGFHRALCVLMGWNNAANSKGVWNRQILPDSEALALKQDLIIWPPVVFIHNSSLGNSNPDKWKIVSIAELNIVVRGMGFGRAITKVCRGSAAYQSIMVVKFQGTFSGLQEAEGLHKLYAESKHGRAEFQQITCGSSYSSYKVQSVLYGYLGIAEDLDKLDFEVKSRYIVKSKKEIQAIADALQIGECLLKEK